MGLEFVIPFALSYLIVWIGFYIFQRINYRNKFLESFSYRNTFTFETHNFISEGNKIIRVWFPVASILGVVPFILFFSLKGFHYTINVHVLIAGVLLLVSILCKVLLFFTKTIDIKFFITQYVIRMLTLFGSILFLIIGIMTTISENFTLYRDNQVVMWVFFALFLALFVVNISCLFSKKFFNWYQFEKAEDGQIKKPNTIGLAKFQWVFDYSEVIFVVLTTIFLYFI
jgi:hypothetical protein